MQQQDLCWIRKMQLNLGIFSSFKAFTFQSIISQRPSALQACAVQAERQPDGEEAPPFCSLTLLGRKPWLPRGGTATAGGVGFGDVTDAFLQ